MTVCNIMQVVRNDGGEDADQSRGVKKPDSQKHQRKWLSRWLPKGGSSNRRGRDKQKEQQMESKASAKAIAPDVKAPASQTIRDATPDPKLAEQPAPGQPPFSEKAIPV